MDAPGWWHPGQCVNEHDEGGNCLDEDGSIVGWREAADDLSLAWAEAEAALPEGWYLHLAKQRDSGKGAYYAYAVTIDKKREATATTPAAALRALAAKLKESE